MRLPVFLKTDLKSIEGKISLISFTPVLVITAIITLLFILINYFFYQSYSDRRNFNTLTKLEKVLSVPVIRKDYSTIVDIIDGEILNSDLKYLWILDSNNNVIISNDEFQVNTIISDDYLKDNSFKCTFLENGLKACILPDSSYLRNIALYTSLITGIAIILVLSIILFFVKRLSLTITAPIYRAVSFSKEIAAGNPVTSLEKSNIIEIDDLLSSLESMSLSILNLKSRILDEKKQLAESEEKYRRIIESLGDEYFFYSSDTNGVLRYVSPSAKRILEYDDNFQLDDIIYNSGNRLINSKFQHQRQMIIKGISQPNIEIEVKSGKGNIKTLRMFEAPVFDDAGKVISIEGIAQDISLYKKIEDQLKQSQKMESIGNLAGGIAHDFNNILGGIIGSLNLVESFLQRESLVNHQKIEEFLKVAQYSSDRAMQLVKQLLAIARKSEMTFKEINLVSSVENVVTLCRNTFPREIDINVELSSSDAICFADSGQLEQALLNICINSLHAMTIMREPGESQKGNISIRLNKRISDSFLRTTHTDAETDIPYWCISISDTGVGMDETTRRKIFEPFFSTKKDDKGTGLGLAMVYSIIQQHNGFIDVYSEKGHGSKFNIYLPESVSLNKSNADINQTATYDKGAGLVLIIDDDEGIRRVTAGILTEGGYDIIEAEDGETGLKLFYENMVKIRAVFLDLSMPGIPGMDVMDEIRKNNPYIKILISSGLYRSNYSDLNDSNTRFISKPFKSTELLQIIKELISFE